MDEPTLTALKESIQKWEGIVAGDGVDLGSYNCALCAIFHRTDSEDTDCKGCPVSMHSSTPLCRNTPYMTWITIEHRALEVVRQQEKVCGGVSVNQTRKYNSWYADTMIVAARAELDFLKSLLPA